MSRLTTIVIILALAVSALAQNGASTEPDLAAIDAAYVANDWQKAAQGYAAVTKSQPTLPRAWYRLGASSVKLGKYKEAIPAFEQFLKLVPNQPFGMYGMATAYAGLKDREKGIEWLEKTLAAGWAQPQQLKDDPDLAFLRDDARFAPLVEQAQRAATPCRYQPESRAFDFWVGEWDVMNPQGMRVGVNKITQILEQCVILEEWTSASGGTGKSINAYNAARKVWQQYWVDAGGNVLELGGPASDGKIAFEGTNYMQDGQTQPYRLTFYRLPDGKVRQHGETSSDGGKTWTTAYDFTYVKKQ